jgi:hypothetical protein
MPQPFIRIKSGLFFLLFMAFFLSSETHAQRTQAAFVTRGAFLLSEKPTVWRSGRIIHENPEKEGRIGLKNG